jgi:hypothetical protein
MSTYKITNTTNTLGKRELMFNSPVTIEYVDNMMKKSVPVQAGAVLYLTVDSLPLSLHRLRVKNYVTIVEVTPEELAKSKVKPAVVTAPEKNEETQKSSGKKKVFKKENQE